MSRRPGVLLEEFIAGTPLNYATNSSGVAETFSRIHNLEIDGTIPLPLINQERMIEAIVEESESMRARYTDHPKRTERIKIEKYQNEIQRRTDEWSREFAQENSCIVNTEVNSGNFIVREGIPILLDWEKAVISYRYQDLGHYVVPTTTLWKSDFLFTRETRTEFLRAYLEYVNLPMSLDELSYLTSIVERVILLRALSWCYMAYYEYTSTNRSLQNKTTFKRISAYLDEIDSFLDRSEPE